MKRLGLLLAPLMALPFASIAHADRGPTAEERAAIEQVLVDAGFSQWKEIELEADDGVWEIDDALGPDGRTYDLELSVNTLEIVKSELD